MTNKVTRQIGVAAVAPAAITGDLIFDEAGAAAYLKVKPRTCRLWRNTRGLPFLRLTGKCVRFRKSDLDGWLSQHLTAIAA